MSRGQVWLLTLTLQSTPQRDNKLEKTTFQELREKSEESETRGVSTRGVSGLDL
jgi:hypothetical protein